MDYNSSITNLKGIGEKNALLFKKLNIETIGDLISHLPRDYEVFPEVMNINELKVGVQGAFVGRVLKEPTVARVRKLTILTVYVGDETGQVRLTFFNMPYLKKTLAVGTAYVFLGTVFAKGANLVIEHPRMIKREAYTELLHVFQPIYRRTKGLSNDAIRKTIQKGLQGLPEEQEYLPEFILKENAFQPYLDCVRQIHNPKDASELKRARKRLAYEDFFFFLLTLKFAKENLKEEKNVHPMLEVSDTERLIEALPYELTASQSQVWREIQSDLCSKEKTLNRLIQGDVGSGKTIVAILALLQTVVNGYQAAMMAPTEVLAVQHYDTIQDMMQKYKLPFQPILLTGSLTAKEKREAKAGIESGQYNLVIATHAILEDNVVFQKIGLVVTDEQHRFGVMQRDKLSEKGEALHRLVMSATPIPRSLAIILYGELEISVIPELPGERLPIKNCVVNPEYRQTAYKFIAEQVSQGRQAYIICPMAEPGVMEELENVVDYAKTLKDQLPDQVQVQYLHGKMRPKEKNRIMEEFAANNIQVLVSTTVIEVGINVPNATVMMVENAERFGLATLHQIRGRVGRGRHQSYCIFLDTKGVEKSKERLEILNHSNDGFFIANEDLRLRGPGDMMGVMQSGNFSFQYADIYADAPMLLAASKDVGRLLAEDRKLESLSYSRLKSKLVKYLEKEYITVL